MAYLWNSIFETGNEEIDDQHKQLFKTLNDIAGAFANGIGSEEICKTLDFLSEYTIKHFKTEEELMRKYNYPEYNMHKMCHEDFKLTVEDFVRQLKKDGPSEDMILNVTVTIGEWLTTHIRIDDIKMSKYIESKEFDD